MSSHGVAPKPWAFSISNHVALMDSLKGDPVAERDMLISLVKRPMCVSLADSQCIDFLEDGAARDASGAGAATVLTAEAGGWGH